MKKLSKNFIWLFAANAVRSILQFLIFIYLARTLSVKAYGLFSYAFTIVLYLMNFIDLGLSTYGIREIAKHKARTYKYVSDIVSFRFLVAICLYGLFAFLILLSKFEWETKLLNLGTGLILFIAASATEWAFQGKEKMHMVFISYLTTSVLQFLLLLTYVKSPQGLLITPLIFVIGNIPIALIFLAILKFRPEVKMIDFNRIKGHLTTSLVIWSISIFAQLYNGFDIILLGLVRSPQEVGYFTVARQIIGGVVIFAIFLSNAALPKLASSFGKKYREFSSARVHLLKALIFLGFLTLVPLLIFSSEIVSFAVGKSYLPASLPIKILAIASIFVFFNIPFSTSLIAAGFEKKVFKQVMVVSIFSVMMNLFFIPRFGMMGAAVTYLFTELAALIWISIIFYINIKKWHFDKIKFRFVV